MCGLRKGLLTYINASSRSINSRHTVARMDDPLSFCMGVDGFVEEDKNRNGQGACWTAEWSCWVAFCGEPGKRWE